MDTKTNLPQELALDFEETCQQIETLIQNTLASLKRDGIVIALSGGLDSAVTVTLCVRAGGAQSITALNLPERDSSPVHQKHARRLAAELGLAFKRKSISPMLRAAGSYRLLPLRFVPFRSWRTRLVEFGKSQFLKDHEESLLADRLDYQADSWVARGNAYAIAKHRMRMVAVYQYAEVHNLMVVGGANLTEVLTGTYSKWGVDHCADVMPIMHLYRSQVEALAEYLDVPAYIRTKPADPDVMPGVNDKGALLGNFVTADLILQKIKQGADPQTLYSQFSQAQVDKLLELYRLSAHMRESPYSLL